MKKPDLLDLYAACTPRVRPRGHRGVPVISPTECPLCGDPVPVTSRGRQAWTCTDPVCVARYNALWKRWRKVRGGSRLTAKVKLQELAKRSAVWAEALKVVFDKPKMWQ